MNLHCFTQPCCLLESACQLGSQYLISAAEILVRSLCLHSLLSHLKFGKWCLMASFPLSVPTFPLWQESQLMGRSLAAKAVVRGDTVVSATGIVPSGTGTSRTQSTSAVAFGRTFGGTPGDWQIGLFVRVPSQELGKKGMLKHLSTSKPGSEKPLCKTSPLCLLPFCLDSA